MNDRAWMVDKTFIPFVVTCPNCGLVTNCDGAFEWKFCPECGKDMRIPGPYRVPSREEWVRQYGTNKQIAGFEKRNKYAE